MEKEKTIQCKLALDTEEFEKAMSSCAAKMGELAAAFDNLAAAEMNYLTKGADVAKPKVCFLKRFWKLIRGKLHKVL